ncbi:hypothetical protein [Photobacterium leiognathi]|nr:hypothetical protein [Photobacterium leiognathi]
MIPSGAAYLVSGITDMRKSIDGLSLIAADVLEMDRNRLFRPTFP